MSGLIATLIKAATILEREAQGLADSHTMDGRWEIGRIDTSAKRDWAEMREVALKLRRAAEYMSANPLGGPAKVFDAIADEIRCGTSQDAAMRLYGVRFEDGTPV